MIRLKEGRPLFGYCIYVTCSGETGNTSQATSEWFQIVQTNRVSYYGQWYQVDQYFQLSKICFWNCYEWTTHTPCKVCLSKLAFHSWFEQSNATIYMIIAYTSCCLYLKSNSRCRALATCFLLRQSRSHVRSSIIQCHYKSLDVWSIHMDHNETIENKTLFAEVLTMCPLNKDWWWNFYITNKSHSTFRRPFAKQSAFRIMLR